MVDFSNIITWPVISSLRIESEAAEILGLSVPALKTNRYVRKGRPYHKHRANVVYDIDNLKTHRALRREKGLPVPPWPEHLK